MNANSKTAAQRQDTDVDEAAAAPDAEATPGEDAGATEAEAGGTTDTGADPQDGDAATQGEAPAAPDAGDEVLRLEAELAEAKDRMMRALADAENTRRRAEREKQDASKYAIASFAREMLSVADNLSRALQSVDDEARNNDAVRTLLEGVEMTEREMLKTFERQGVRRIEAEGKILDPNLHEAMYEIPDETKPQGTVVQVVEDGYVLNDRLLRPAKVGVAKGGPKPEPKAEAAGQAGKPGAAAYESGGGAAGGETYDQEL